MRSPLPITPAQFAEMKEMMAMMKHFFLSQQSTATTPTRPPPATPFSHSSVASVSRMESRRLPSSGRQESTVSSTTTGSYRTFESSRLPRYDRRQPIVHSASETSISSSEGEHPSPFRWHKSRTNNSGTMVGISQLVDEVDCGRGERGHPHPPLR